MIWVDYFIISIIIISSLMSLIRGFVHEILSLITWIYGLFITNRYYIYFTKYFTHFEKPMIRNGIAIFILFLITLIIGTIINHIINFLLEQVGFLGTNKFLGLFFGILRGILIISIVLFFLNNFTDLPNSQDWQRSLIIPQFKVIIKYIYHLYSNILQETQLFF